MSATPGTESRYVGIWPFRRKLCKIFPRWSAANAWAKKQNGYDLDMTFKQYRLWMNRTLGTKVLGTDGVESGSQKWLDAIDSLEAET